MINDALIELDDLRREHARLKLAYASLKADYERLGGKAGLCPESVYEEPEVVEIVLSAADAMTLEEVANDCLASLRAELAKLKP
jgi:hypothetical protein